MKKITLILSSLFLSAACTSAPLDPSEIDPAFATQYLEYSESTLTTSLAKGPVLLNFHADWCPSCVALTKELQKEISQAIPANMTILEVDYDTEKELKKIWEIRLQHTLIQLDQQGNEVTRWSGGNLATLKDQIIIN
ncbi:thioredoxin family protein [Candidatus Gracilibacteria bacterium]|nr:thioredoxin family protein [Candidatus Gracilibacteria bacterium]